MDVLAHGLWTGAAYKAAQMEEKEKLKVGWAVFWGVFPDIFAFGPAFLFLFYHALILGEGFGAFSPHARFEQLAGHQAPLIDLSGSLYNLSHSLFIFAAVFGAVWLFNKKPVWELCGWLLHILMDIPTHSYRFFPTPFLWPFSDWKLNGFSWGTPWFMALNYGFLAILYFLLSRRKLNRPFKTVLVTLGLILAASYIFAKSG